MKKITAISALSLAGIVLSFTQCATSQSPLSRLKRIIPYKDCTQVVVLATFHFREEVKPSMLGKLIEKLEAFEPDVIAIEVLPGDRVHEIELRSNATMVHEEVVNTFMGAHLDLGHRAQKLLGIDCIQARKNIAGNPLPFRTPEEMRNKVLQYLAAYEWPTALLAWLYASSDERGQMNLPQELSQKLDSLLESSGEVQQLAIPLAKKLKIETIACVDDFEDFDANAQNWNKFLKHLPILNAESQPPFRADYDNLKATGIKNGDLLPLFRYLNSNKHQHANADGEWGAYLRKGLEDKSDRGRVALYENRNMKIAANIRALSALNPGKRILVIYGANHKHFLDAYLSLASDLMVIQPAFSNH
jgi:hypothetical protein